MNELKASRRALFNLGALAGLTLAAPSIIRPASGITQMRREGFSFGGLVPLNNWLAGPDAKMPAVRLCFDTGNDTAWMRYNRGCLTNSIRGVPEAVEVSIWAPNGMRAVTRIPIDAGVILG